MPALAADGKRIRGANRNADGETAALRALLEDVDLRGCVVTLDPLHSACDTKRAIVETQAADYVLSINANCPDTFAQLAAVVRRHGDPPAKGRGRVAPASASGSGTRSHINVRRSPSGDRSTAGPPPRSRRRSDERSGSDDSGCEPANATPGQAP